MKQLTQEIVDSMSGDDIWSSLEDLIFDRNDFTVEEKKFICSIGEMHHADVISETQRKRLEEILWNVNPDHYQDRLINIICEF